MDEFTTEFERAAIDAIDVDLLTQDLKPSYVDLIDQYYVQGRGPTDIGERTDATPYAVDMRRKYILKKIRLAAGIELAA